MSLLFTNQQSFLNINSQTHSLKITFLTKLINFRNTSRSLICFLCTIKIYHCQLGLTFSSVASAPVVVAPVGALLRPGGHQERVLKAARWLLDRRHLLLLILAADNDRGFAAAGVL